VSRMMRTPDCLNDGLLFLLDLQLQSIPNFETCSEAEDLDQGFIVSKRRGGPADGGEQAPLRMNLLS